MLAAILSDNQLPRNTKEYCDRRKGRKIKSNKKACDGSTYVCTHNDAYCLGKAHKARGNEAYRHNRRCRGALNKSCYNKTCEHSGKAVFRKHSEYVLKSVSEGLFRVLTHHKYTAKKKTYAAKKVYYALCHSYTPRT